jgi:hypothetical protein
VRSVIPKSVLQMPSEHDQEPPKAQFMFGNFDEPTGKPQPIVQPNEPQKAQTQDYRMFPSSNVSQTGKETSMKPISQPRFSPQNNLHSQPTQRKQPATATHSNSEQNKDVPDHGKKIFIGNILFAQTVINNFLCDKFDCMGYHKTGFRIQLETKKTQAKMFLLSCVSKRTKRHKFGHFREVGASKKTKRAVIPVLRKILLQNDTNVPYIYFARPAKIGVITFTPNDFFCKFLLYFPPIRRSRESNAKKTKERFSTIFFLNFI